MRRHCASIGRRCSALRLSVGAVSGMYIATSARHSAANPATAASAWRQPKALATTPPSNGLVSAIKPSPVSALDITRAPSPGAYRSRTMARAHTTAAAMPTPCSARQATSASMLPASALPMPAASISASPPSSTGRRP